MKRTIAASLLLAAVALPLPITAHHSAAQFDDSRCLNLTGTVRKLSLSYPHGWIWLQTGTTEDSVWAVELTDPASLRVAGWLPSTVRKGDKLDVVTHPIRDGRKIAVAEMTHLPDGRVISGGPRPKCPQPWAAPAPKAP